MSANTPTVSLLGKFTHDTPMGSRPYPMSVAIVGVSDFSIVSKTLAPGSETVVHAPTELATHIRITSPRPLHVRLNGGEQAIRFAREFVLLNTEITSVTLVNDIGEPTLRQINAEIFFVAGGRTT